VSRSNTGITQAHGARRAAGYSHNVRDLLRKHGRFFLLAGLAGLTLRLLFFFRFPAVTADSLVYGDITRNWLTHGIYGLTEGTRIVPTLIRLPGYPAFLAAIFAVFGQDSYKAVLLLQIGIDIASCFLLADLARRTISDRAAGIAFLLSALCPFFANYAAAALTETLEIFFTTLALDLVVIAFDELQIERLRYWMAGGLALACAILLRPDGGILLAAIGAYLMWLLMRPQSSKALPSAARGRMIVKAGLTMVLFALLPLVPWTARNWRTFHQFQPLSPRYANAPGDYVPMGFNRWVKTWMADYVSVEEIYWAVPGDALDRDKLPERAFDSEAERAATEEAFAEYNRDLRISPELDQRFAALAAQRIRAAPLRYYVWLPLLRMADMWLRPRTEILPSDTRWWEFNDDPKWSALAVGLGLLNLGYAGLAVAGLFAVRRRPGVRYLGLFLLFLGLRTAFLGTLENPEPRYTLECYGIVFLWACAGLVIRDSAPA
jgi:4-amino-4-deoxy-L-arabinose transferase-like glycosyltransferase